jgi:hypothetical protein
MARNPCQSDHPSVHGCNVSMSYRYGHDGGSTECFYDLSRVLEGASTCGVPPFPSPPCTCTNADNITPCAGYTVTDLCAVDGGSPADH